MELKELIKYARDNKCSDLHITAGEAVAVRKYGELELLDITPFDRRNRRYDILNSW